MCEKFNDETEMTAIAIREGTGKRPMRRQCKSRLV
jgi:hypothetical protein